MPDPPLVQVHALTHRFGDVLALDSVSFNLPEAAVFALLGPNGSGKTTLFRILTTLLTPDSGKALIAGADVVAERAAVLGSIGVVFQKPALDARLTAFENLIHHGQLYGLRGGALRERASQLLDRFGLVERMHDRVERLSGGMQRRVELAKCLLHQPRVLLLDEPSTGLDPGARLTLMEHLYELRERDGVTSLLTTHLMEEAEKCTQVAILDAGRLIALDTPAALKAAIGGDIVSIDAADPQALASRLQERFGTKVEWNDGRLRLERSRGHEFVPQLIEAFPGEINGVSIAKPNLEDVFLRLTGHRFADGTRDR